MNWLAFAGILDRARSHRSLGDCPGCGDEMVSPTTPRGYVQPHCRHCAHEIEDRQEVRLGRV